MKIVVCIKQVPDSNEVKMDPVTHTIIREGIAAIINPFDSFAIEESIRLKERYGGEIVGLSMGIPAVANILKEAIATGLDSALLLSDRAFAGADTLATAYALALGVKSIGRADLILCGKMSTDGDTAQVGPMLAEVLGIPHATDISEIMAVENGVLFGRKMVDEGYQLVEVKLPAVVTVNKEINIPRLPSMSGFLNVQHYQVPVYTAAEVKADASRIGLSGSPTQVVRTFVPDLTINTKMLAGNSQEQAAQLLTELTAHNIWTKEN